MDTVTDLGRGIRYLLRTKADVRRPPRDPTVGTAKHPGGRDGHVHPVRIARVDQDGVHAHPAGPRLPVGPERWVRRPAISDHVRPPSVDLKSEASSAPAKTVSGSSDEGSRCHTRANSQG